MELHVDPWKLIFLVLDAKYIWIYWEKSAYLFIHFLFIPDPGNIIILDLYDSPT